MSVNKITPGWYKSAQAFLPNAICVHCVEAGRVYFTRRGIAHMSIRSIESFREIVACRIERRQPNARKPASVHR